MLQPRQVTFARPAAQATQQYQAQYAAQQQQAQQQQAQAQQSNGLALPYGTAPYLPGPSSLALPGPAPAAPSYPPHPQAATQSQQQPQSQTQSQTVVGASQSSAGPSTPAPAIPSTPAPLTLEQQHITAVEGIVPTLQNIVATVNLDCRLDLKTIALHARNAEYNPKVCTHPITSFV